MPNVPRKPGFFPTFPVELAKLNPLPSEAGANEKAVQGWRERLLAVKMSVQMMTPGLWFICSAQMNRRAGSAAPAPDAPTGGAWQPTLP
jgi:hypothetical protein